MAEYHLIVGQLNIYEVMLASTDYMSGQLYFLQST